MSLKKSLEKLKAAIMMSETPADTSISNNATTPQEQYDRSKRAAEQRCQSRHPNDQEAYNRCMFNWYRSNGKCCCKTVGGECQCTVKVNKTYTGGTVVSDSYTYTTPGPCIQNSNGVDVAPSTLPGIICRDCNP